MLNKCYSSCVQDSEHNLYHQSNTKSTIQKVEEAIFSYIHSEQFNSKTKVDDNMGPIFFSRVLVSGVGVKHLLLVNY